jgi:hypothetical protein
MMMLSIAGIGADRGLLFGSFTEPTPLPYTEPTSTPSPSKTDEPNGCTADLGDFSGCGYESQMHWTCEATPKPSAPNCRICRQPDGDGFSILSCPAVRIVKDPPECCHFGGPYMIPFAQTAFTGAPPLKLNNGSGFGPDMNGFPYGVKSYDETGKAWCTVHRAALNNPKLFPYTAGVMGGIIFMESPPHYMWSGRSDTWEACDWDNVTGTKGEAACLDVSPFKNFGPQAAKMLDQASGSPAYRDMVQECTADDPLDGQAVADATYALGRNPDTGCHPNLGGLYFKTSEGESNPCDGTTAYEMAHAAKDGQALSSEAQAFLAELLP